MTELLQRKPFFINGLRVYKVFVFVYCGNPHQLSYIMEKLYGNSVRHACSRTDQQVCVGRDVAF